MKRLLFSVLLGGMILTQAIAASTEKTSDVNSTLPQPAATEDHPAASASEGCGCSGNNAPTNDNKNLETHDVAKPPVQGS